MGLDVYATFKHVTDEGKVAALASLIADEPISVVTVGRFREMARNEPTWVDDQAYWEHGGTSQLEEPSYLHWKKMQEDPRIALLNRLTSPGLEYFQIPHTNGFYTWREARGYDWCDSTDDPERILEVLRIMYGSERGAKMAELIERLYWNA